MSALFTLKQYLLDEDSTPEPKNEKQQVWINRLTFAALICALTFAVVYPLVTPFPAFDFEVFLASTRGELSDYYYAPWLIPIFKVFTFFTYDVARVLGNVVNVLCFLYAVHVFKGNKILLLTSYSLLFSMFYGQLDGLHALGLAVMFVAIKRDNWVLAGFAWMLAGAKFYIGIPLGIGLIWCYGNDMNIRIKIVLFTLFLVACSFVIWPNWLHELIVRIQANPPYTTNSIDTWDLTGPIVVALWAPVFLSRTNNYLWWVATWALTVPYMHIHGMNQVLVMPVGPIGWLIQLNYVIGFNQAFFLLIIPLWVYLKAWWASWRTDWLSIGLQRVFHRSSPQPVLANEATISAD